MHLLSILVFCLIGMKIGVVAELSASACSLLRTTASMTTIVPEMVQIAMRYYQVAAPAEVHHREKRFLFNDNASKEPVVVKASVFEQVVANAFKDVNYTRVAQLIFSSNETMSKMRQNIDVNAIVRAAMREVDYEKLGSSLYYSAEAEFDLEYVVTSLLHTTHLDLVYEELMTNGTLSPALIKSLHPNINVETVQKALEWAKNFLRQFAKTMNTTQNLEEYLFEKVQQYALTPLGKMIQEVKKQNPTTLDQLVEIVLDNLNKVVMVRTSLFDRLRSIDYLS